MLCVNFRDLVCCVVWVVIPFFVTLIHPNCPFRVLGDLCACLKTY